MKGEIILQALGALLAALVSFYQIRNNIPRSRNKLKQDLEILKLLSPDSESYKIINETIDKEVYIIYALKAKKSKYDLVSYKTIDLVVGTLFFFGGTIWTFFQLSQPEPKLWTIVSIIFAVGGLGQIFAALGNRWTRNEI